MEYYANSEFGLLSARICDYARKSQAGELSVSDFLSPSEVALARVLLAEQRIAHRGVFLGGYGDAERQKLFLLPSYTDDLDGNAKEKLDTYFSDERDSEICAVKISGSGYRELSHRDYLGSILALGIERDALGDIVLVDEYSACVFCPSKIKEFLELSLERVASDAVRVTDFTVTEEFSANREYKRILSTVASNRLDCVVSALTGLSREKSQELIRHELCQLNYITECRCDRTLDAPCTLSLRGYGKFILRELEGLTKKGRLKMSADKYI
ncbi:MAG: hypothetical protein IJW65_02995 [Clostridia bacterium]|nr:hypothetical protein [Clostridia bacterium]